MPVLVISYGHGISSKDKTEWISSLPEHICDRFRGLSEGSGIPLERIAHWGYQEIALSQGCSSIICRSKGKVRIGHNNDTFVPELWGYITILEIKGRIPTMCFGLAGDIWATAGINKAKLWLHVDHLKATDRPDSRKAVLPTYGFIVEALETCETIDDVQGLLNKIDRTEGMILIAWELVSYCVALALRLSNDLSTEVSPCGKIISP